MNFLIVSKVKVKLLEVHHFPGQGIIVYGKVCNYFFIIIYLAVPFFNGLQKIRSKIWNKKNWLGITILEVIEIIKRIYFNDLIDSINCNNVYFCIKALIDIYVIEIFSIVKILIREILF